ncbi:beta strand repeat-containing protein [Ramlibacter montanisoli]|uniref:Uncharacterized protein n=1 Tax=Ramlibacter montanisoli TaxID=2732512 RepID=A0A849KG88_9BURK|nr:hypothetical protein [Ramlibacter montanisoli]NNU43173.1 hypothetical protein [Ramlibacter montanisoli]
MSAAVAVNFLDADTTARIGSNVTITATGAMEVQATSVADAVAQGLSTATNTNADTGVAGAVSLNIALIDNRAEVGDATLSADSIAVEAKMASGETNTFQSRALAGAASKQTAVGGSVSINIVVQDTAASVAGGATLTATAGSVDVFAESKNELQNIAGGAAISTQSGGTGIGIAIALNVVDQETRASIGDKPTLGDAAVVTASDSVSVKATSSVLPKSEELPVIGTVAVTSFAAGVAGAAGGNAVGGSSSVNIFLVDTSARIGTLADVTATGGDIEVAASDTLTLVSAAGGLAASTGNAGVGIGLDVGVIVRDTTASVGAGADLVAGDDISVEATSADDITSIAGTFGLSTSGTGVAASIAVQVLSTQTRAFLEDSPDTSLDAGGDVTIRAQGDLDSLMIGGAIGGGSSAGVGVANTTMVHIDTVEARIGAGNLVESAGSDGVKVEAVSTEEFIAITAAGAAASSVGVAVAPTINVLSETTTASVGRGAAVNSTNGIAAGVPDLVVKASDATTIVSVAGSIGAAGSVGVAVGADVLSLVKNTSAFIDSGVIADVEGDIDVNAMSSEDVTSVAAGIAVGGSAGVGVNASVHVLNMTTRAYIGDLPDSGPASLGAGDVHAGGTVRIAADDVTEMDKVVATVAVGGSAGVGAAATVSVVNKNTQAFIGQGAKVTGDGNTAGLSVNTGTFNESFVVDARPCSTPSTRAMSTWRTIPSTWVPPRWSPAMP